MDAEDPATTPEIDQRLEALARMYAQLSPPPSALARALARLHEVQSILSDEELSGLAAAGDSATPAAPPEPPPVDPSAPSKTYR